VARVCRAATAAERRKRIRGRPVLKTFDLLEPLKKAPILHDDADEGFGRAKRSRNLNIALTAVKKSRGARLVCTSRSVTSAQAENSPKAHTVFEAQVTPLALRFEFRQDELKRASARLIPTAAEAHREQ
jgi:hypothetical protein